MSYISTPIFYRKPLGVPMYKPTESVDCFVVRADLFGKHAFGQRGVYHTGMLFKTRDKEWALELVLNDFSTLLPRIVNGKAVNDNFMTLGYYPPLDAHLWRSYWTVTSARVCTLTPIQYEALVHWILSDFGPAFPRYVPFGITGKPVAVVGVESERQTDRVYTIQNTCDKLGMRSFEWLASYQGVKVEPFPVTRLALQTALAPVRVAPTDPGLLAYAREIESFRGDFAALSNKDYGGLIKLMVDLKTAKVGPFQYTLSLDPVTFEQSFYELSPNDLTVSISDVLVRVNPRPAHQPTPVFPRPVDPLSWGAMSTAMWDPNAPVPAEAVPCAQMDAVASAWDMNTTYDDRLRAQQSQNIVDSCVYGVRPPGLPVWPPPTLDNYPRSSRMDGNETGEVANTASVVIAEREFAASGDVQPADLSFGRSATGALTIQSRPLLEPGTNPAVANAARIYNEHWELPIPTPQPARPIPLVPSADEQRVPGWPSRAADECTYQPGLTQSGCAAVGCTWYQEEASPWEKGPNTNPSYCLDAHPSGAVGGAVGGAPPHTSPVPRFQAFGAAVAPVDQVALARHKRSTKKVALRAAQTHAGNLSTAIPGLFYDLAHIDEIRSAEGSRYSTAEFLFGRGSRGLYISIIFSLAAVIAGAARCIEN